MERAKNAGVQRSNDEGIIETTRSNQEGKCAWTKKREKRKE
jgi:hypothetical protein